MHESRDILILNECFNINFQQIQTTVDLEIQLVLQ